MARNLTLEDKAKFFRMVCDLSPENLCCDGEISPREAHARGRRIWSEWRKLENELGGNVTEEEAWRWGEELRHNANRNLNNLLSAYY